MRELETPLSKRLLKGDAKTGDTVVADYNTDEGLTFNVEHAATVGVEA